MVDLPDEKVKVHGHKDFITLKPGESWTTEQTIQTHSPLNWTWIPDDSEVGDKFKFLFKGVALDWWDWGGEQEMRDREVELACTNWAPVQKPEDNDGRPKLIVPGSNSVEFTIVDD